MKNKLSGIALLALCIAGAANAKDAAKTTACAMTETGNISVTFNARAKNFADAKAVYDKKVADVSQAVKQSGGKAMLQSSSYNIAADNYYTPDSDLRVDGSMSYMLSSEAATLKLADALAQQKLQVSTSLSKTPTEACAAVPAAGGE